MDRFSVNKGPTNTGGTSASSPAGSAGTTCNNGKIITATAHNGNSNGSCNSTTTTTTTSSSNSINNNSTNNINNTNNNAVKIRPERNNGAVSSVDSVVVSSSSATSLLAGTAPGYRKLFHRSGPGSASATSDYSMSTVAESIQDEQLSTGGNSPPASGNSVSSMLQHSNGSGSVLQPAGHPGGGGLAGGHNIPGLPGIGPQNNSNLTQAGLEEYSRSYYEQTMYHHQKQSSYAQSEGYHSYVSSSDSSSTPFLDRLRQDSDLLLSRSAHTWSQQDLQQLSASNNSIADNNSSESTSSTETLKWLGSMSDVSEASHATSMSALSSAGSTSQLIAHSSRVRTPQRHNSESILYMTTDEQHQHQQQQQHQLQQHLSHQSPTAVGVGSIGGLVSQSMGSLHHHHLHHHHHHQHQVPLGQHSVEASPNGGLTQLSPHQKQGSSSSSPGGSPIGEGDLRFQHRASSNASLASSSSAPTTTGSGNNNNNTWIAGGNGPVRSSRSNNRLFPISTYTEIPSNVSSNSSSNNCINSNSNINGNNAFVGGSSTPLVDSSKQLSPHSWQSVADRINELEKHQQQGLSLLNNNNNNNNNNNSNSGNNSIITSSASIGAKNLSHAAAAKQQQQQQQQQQQPLPRYTYFDPSKTHRVSNPSLKAFQKNAVISYFERQQAHARESSHNLSRPTTLNLQQHQTGSPPSHKSVSQRSSISSAYSSSESTMDLTTSSHSSIAGSYNHHTTTSMHSPASIAAQQQLDKIAANNLRNQLASVHTMNILNKVQSPLNAQLIDQQMISNATLILSANGNGTTVDASISNGSSPTSPEDPLDTNVSPPPPPPRSRSIVMPAINSTASMATATTHAAHLATVRRTSSASEYSSIRDKMIQQRQQLSKDLLGPMIMGPIIALDDWVPERPPKNPMLRIPSPELPPPPPTMSPTEDVILLNQDEPLPPPPPEILRHIRQLSDSGEPKSNPASRRNSFAGQTNKKSLYRASTLENLSPPPPGAPPPPPQSQQAQISQLIIPPTVPKKPQSVESQVLYRRPSTSMSKSLSKQSNGTNYIHQAHRVIVNGKADQRHSLPMPLQPPAQIQPVPQVQFVPRQSESRLSMRKRSHNSQQIPVAEYLLKAVHQQNGQIVPTGFNNNNNNNNSMNVLTNATMTSPPPLKPRMPVQSPESLNGQLISMGSKSCTGRDYRDYQVTDCNNNVPPCDSSDDDAGSRSFGSGNLLDCRAHSSASVHSDGPSSTRDWSNSKASYLPRQPRDKLHSDPDHGSYKLTLTSNEDCINHNDVFSEEIITSPKCNLPDVLPPGVKYSLYSSNNNNNSNTTSGSCSPANGKPTVGKPPKSNPHSAPIISANSLKSMFNFSPQQLQQNQVTPPSASSPVTPPPTYSAATGQQSPSLPGSPTNQAVSPKYTSQSTFDLKKTQILDTQYLTQSSAQIGLPPIPNHHQQQQQPQHHSLAEPINNTNYLNHQHSTNNGCSQKTVNNYNEFSEKSDSFESSISTSTCTVESVETNHNNTNTNTNSAVQSSVRDEFSAKEEETTISSKHNSTCAEANHPEQPITCGGKLTTSFEESNQSVALVERVTKEINLEPVHTSACDSNTTAPAKIVQRTEIVLRVGAATSEASSQTDDDLASSDHQPSHHSPASHRSSPPSSPNQLTVGIAELVIEQQPSQATTGQQAAVGKHSVATSTVGCSPPSTPTGGKSPTGGFFSKACTAAPRKVHPEEIDCDKLSHDLISQLSPSDKLHTILAPKTFKSSSDYVSDLFNIQIAPRPMKKDASTATPEASPQKSPLDILTTSSTYFQVSEPKAKLMTRYSREMTLINGDCCDLTKKKEELVQRLGKKLLVLSNEQTSIAEESNANDLLGNDVALKVAQKVRPTDASKFRSYVDDVGYITMLLLSLSGRLARTDNALHNIDDSHPDKKILEAKRDRLLEQLDEAKQLKDDIDRRGAIISKILEKSLTIEEYADYDYFINMKAKLIVDSREIADKIKLGEEQLAALKDTLVQSEC
ncbi:protein Shroom isoform X2 [Malaya genurostris]|uniref:protein Shroom isoform X2 n=1 Tax=Malaya genurostris TaxID=325434 RepID=UPI0026F38110|nr:protein Shroom isoform X2 [Malaya genurostris]